MKCAARVSDGGEVLLLYNVGLRVRLHCPYGSWQGFSSQKLPDRQLLDKSDVLSFVTKDVGLALATRRLA